MAEMRRMTPVELVDRVISSEHAYVVRDSVAWVAAELMEAEVAGEVGAELGEVSSQRVTQRNGYRPRAWDKRAGAIEQRSVQPAVLLLKRLEPNAPRPP